MSTKTEKTDNRKKPVHEERAGAIRAAIWEQDGKDGVFYKFTLERLYKTPDGWKSTDSFSHRDPSNISAAASLASAWIAQRVAGQAAEAAPQPAPAMNSQSRAAT